MENIQLNEKRQALQKKALERSRLELISDFLNTLAEYSISHEVDFGSKTAEWISDKFSVASWGRINWDETANKIIYQWKIAEDIPVLLEEIVSEHSLETEDVAIVWSNAERPSITMKFEDAKKVIQEICDEDFDAWIVSEDKGWCIEYSHHGQLSIAFV